jgi:flagellar basal body P-ring formation protein FlgA
MSMQKYFAWLFLLVGVALAHTRAQAAGYQSLSSIQAAAEQHLRQLLPADGSTLYIKATALDDRLRLAACPAPLDAFLPSGANISARVTVGVRCNQGTQWTLYTPVSIESEAPMLVLNKALARGAMIGSQDVDTRVQRIAGVVSDSLKSLGEISGKRLKRDLPAGTVLSPAMLEPELLIRRGQQVTMIARLAGIEVRSQGVALSDGRASSRIQVKNLNSAKVVEGLVDSNSVVRVEL